MKNLPENIYLDSSKDFYWKTFPFILIKRCNFLSLGFKITLPCLSVNETRVSHQG